MHEQVGQCAHQRGTVVEGQRHSRFEGRLEAFRGTLDGELVLRFGGYNGQVSVLVGVRQVTQSCSPRIVVERLE